jgi:hypothetical protein
VRNARQVRGRGGRAFDPKLQRCRQARVAGVERGTCLRIERRDIIQHDIRHDDLGKLCVGMDRLSLCGFDQFHAGRDAIESGTRGLVPPCRSPRHIVERNHISGCGILHGGIHRCVLGGLLLLVS